MSGKEPGYVAPDVALVQDAHRDKYIETNGEVGYIWNGASILLLTTTGSKTGQKRVIPIIYCQDGENFILIASHAGNPKHPAWFNNLMADPNAEVQVKADKWAVRARVAEGDERKRLWDLSAVQWPNYNVYTTRTTRVIPVVVLEPVRKL
jgi:deazaflavin-dependent oxidoreductase (nitroreductase family)